MVIVLAAIIFIVLGGSALATRYAGNSREPGYGVKAIISTPATMPSVSSGVAFSRVSNQDGPNWIQTGWAQGDGVVMAPDGTNWPTVPTSYQESMVNGYYDLYLFSAQPLNYTRTYEVVHTGSGTWLGYIAGSSRFYAGPFATPTHVEAMTEISGSSTYVRTRASFTSVSYKGNYSYMLFDQNYRRQDAPPYATFNSNSSYTCYNGM
jgi:hypothetical protein